ncbi:MAG: ABC-type transport system involved in multi-copper enzyme maturation, permease component, partial [uncultured Frankineae bacterium]
ERARPDRARRRRARPAHRAGGGPSAGHPLARRADGGAARPQRLGLLEAGRRRVRRRRAHQRRGPHRGLAGPQPGHVRPEPHRCPRHHLPRRSDAVRGGGVGAGARRPRPAGAPVCGAARQVAGTRAVRRRLHRPGRARAAGRGVDDRGLLAAAPGDRPAAARRADDGPAHARSAAVDGDLADGLGHRRRRPVRRDLDRRGARRRRRGLRAGERGAGRRRVADAAADRRPVARGHARLPGREHAGAVRRTGRGGRLPVPQPVRPDADLPGVRRPVGRGRAGARRSGVLAARPV